MQRKGREITDINQISEIIRKCKTVCIYKVVTGNFTAKKKPKLQA